MDKQSLVKTPIEEMTDHEILMELIKDKRRNDRNRYIGNTIRVIVAVAVIVLLIIIVPPVVRFFRQLNETTTQISSGIAQAAESVENVRGQIQDSITKIEEYTGTVREQVSDSIGQLQEAADTATDKISQSADDIKGFYNDLQKQVNDLQTNGIDQIKDAGEQLNELLDNLPAIFK